MSSIARNLVGPYPRGVPSPRAVHVHPYPTRYHGTINTRPMFGKPYKRQPHAVFKPDDFNRPVVSGLGSLQVNTGRGIFLPEGYGGGIFDENISGLGYSVSNLPWHSYSPDTLNLQQDLNKALKDLGQPSISEDGKLGDATCSAAKYVQNSSGYGYVDVPPECSKTHASTSVPPIVAPPIDQSDAALLPRAGMSSTTKNVLIFVGAGAAALGVAYFVMKRKG